MAAKIQLWKSAESFLADLLEAVRNRSYNAE